MSFADLKAPGTKFGAVTAIEWEMELRKRFPEGDILTYASMKMIRHACRDILQEYRDGVRYCKT